MWVSELLPVAFEAVAVTWHDVLIEDKKRDEL